MVIGVLAIWMPAIFSNQKQSFLRFPYCMAALLISTVTNLAANLAIMHKTSRHGLPYTYPQVRPRPRSSVTAKRPRQSTCVR